MKKPPILKVKRGLSFDKAWVENHIKIHKTSLEELNEKLIPNAKNDELKSLLNKNVEKIKNHLEAAQKLQRDIL